MPSASHIKVKNTTGQPASDLHITFTGSNGNVQIDPASVRPKDGRKSPAVPSNDVDRTNEGVIEWSTPVVDPGDTVEFDAATEFGPLGFGSGYWTGPTKKGAREKLGPVDPKDIEIQQKTDKSERDSFDRTLDNPDFLKQTEEAAKKVGKPRIDVVLARAKEMGPMLLLIESPEQLLRLPWGDGTRLDNFEQLAALFAFCTAHGTRDCSREWDALVKAAADLTKSQDALASAQAQLAAAEAALQAAQATLTKAEKDLRAAQLNTNHNILEFPFSILAMMYEAAFRVARDKAQRAFDAALLEVKNLQELVKIREKAVAAGQTAYAQALSAYLRCTGNSLI